jgi:hypothetical protein
MKQEPAEATMRNGHGSAVGIFAMNGEEDVKKLSIFLESPNSSTVVPRNHKLGSLGDGFKALGEKCQAERNGRGLPDSGVLGELALVLRGGVADYGFEVVDEMGLVEVAEVEGELRPIGLGAGVELFY